MQTPLLAPPLLVCLAAATAAQQPGQEARSVPAELAEIAVAYAAKVGASAVFVSGRTIESVLDEEMAPDAPIQTLVRPFLRYEVDRDQQTVTAHILGRSATAAFVRGLGCTLVRGDSLATLRARALPPESAPRDRRPWPLGDELPALPLPAGVDAERLDAAIAYAFAEPEGKPKVRTRAVVVVKDGVLLAERYAKGCDAASVLPGWSMSKTWVNALVGLRVAAGKLDPAAPLPVPEWAAADDPRRALHLDDLLCMQSGLQWSEDYEAAGSDVLRMLFTSADYGGVAAGKPLAERPGTHFRYSSGTTNLICRILRTTFADDAAYMSFPRRELFGPLGMRSACLEPDPSGTFVGSSFGFATARDWAKFGLFYLQDGVWDGHRLLPEGWVKSARTPGVERGDFGRHLWLNVGGKSDPEQPPFARLPRNLFDLSGHEGQYVACFPTERICVVRLGCTKRGGFDLHGFLQQVLAACGG